MGGFAFALCKREALEESEGCARSLSFDMQAQWRGLEKTGQFRFTPPTHAILAFKQALDEWKQEGYAAARGGRYAENMRVIEVGLAEMGFEFYVPKDVRGHIILT